MANIIISKVKGTKGNYRLVIKPTYESSMETRGEMGEFYKKVFEFIHSEYEKMFNQPTQANVVPTPVITEEKKIEEAKAEVVESIVEATEEEAPTPFIRKGRKSKNSLSE